MASLLGPTCGAAVSSLAKETERLGVIEIDHQERSGGALFRVILAWGADMNVARSYPSVPRLFASDTSASSDASWAWPGGSVW